MQILHYPNEKLTQPTWDCYYPVPSAIVTSLLDVVDKYGALGLAANQVGMTCSVIVVLRKIMVNPRILETRNKIVMSEEECLSIPGEKYTVPRYPAILVEWQTPDLKRTVRQVVTGGAAYVVQHEIDHLKGILINENT